MTSQSRAKWRLFTSWNFIANDLHGAKWIQVEKCDVEDVRCWFKRMLALKLSDTDFEKKFKFDSCHRLEPDEFVINEPNHLASGDASSLNHKPQESY